MSEKAITANDIFFFLDNGYPLSIGEHEYFLIDSVYRRRVVDNQVVVEKSEVGLFDLIKSTLDLKNDDFAKNSKRILQSELSVDKSVIRSISLLNKAKKELVGHHIYPYEGGDFNFQVSDDTAFCFSGKNMYQLDLPILTIDMVFMDENLVEGHLFGPGCYLDGRMREPLYRLKHSNENECLRGY